MVKRISMNIGQPKNESVLHANVPSMNNFSKISLGSTLAQCAEMKQMLRRIQGIPSGCSSCGGKK